MPRKTLVYERSIPSRAGLFLLPLAAVLGERLGAANRIALPRQRVDAGGGADVDCSGVIAPDPARLQAPLARAASRFCPLQAEGALVQGLVDDPVPAAFLVRVPAALCLR